MKFYDNEKKVRFLTVVDGQPVFAHRGQNGVLKNISPAITGVRVMSDGRIRVTLSESDTKEGSVYDATGVVTPNKTNFWGVASDIAVNIDGNIAKITGNFTCWTVETHRAHQEWLTTPDGMEWAEERRHRRSVG